MIQLNNEYTFHIKSQGERTKEWFEGDFTVYCILDNAQQMDVALRVDRYNQGSKSLPEQYKLFNRTMSELEVRILKSPTWWKESGGGWTLHDANIVYEVFALAMKGEQVWSDRLKEKTEAAEKAANDNPVKKATPAVAAQ